MDIQEVLHAVEELYYFRRYHDAIEFTAKILNGESREVLDAESLQLLEKYDTKCKEKAKTA